MKKTISLIVILISVYPTLAIANNIWVTIKSGVTVKFETDKSLQINGTLIAQGLHNE